MELAKELDTLTSVPAPRFSQVLRGGGGKEGGMGGLLSDENKVLWPLSSSGYREWVNRSESDIRSALKAKVVVGKGRAYASGSETPSDESLRMSA